MEKENNSLTLDVIITELTTDLSSVTLFCIGRHTSLEVDMVKKYLMTMR